MKTTPFPKYLSIQTSSLCNASCIFCPYKDIKDLFPEKIMRMDLYKKIIEESSNHKNIERIILYMNNEPLTDPYLIERINYAKEKIPWASVHILTNGLLLTDEMADKLINSKLDWIGISFHGIRKETIEKAMGIPRKVTLERINNFIDKAKEKKNIKDYLMITFLKHKYLILQEKKEAINFWKSKGIERISYFDGPVSRAGNVKDLPKVFHKEKIIGCKSIWADDMLHIVEDGKVILCCMDWRRQVILGDLNQASIYRVWNGKRKKIWEMIASSSDMPQQFLCKKCEEAILVDKKEKVLLTLLAPWGVDTPPLGVACLSTFLRENNIGVDVFDFNIELYNAVPQKHRYLWSMNYSRWWREVEKYSEISKELYDYMEPLISRLVDSPHSVIGFSLPTNCSDLLIQDIVQRIKKRSPEKIIVLGGVSISIKEQRVDLLRRLGALVDYCVVGEGEEVFYQLLRNIFDNRAEGISKLKGVIKKGKFNNDVESAQIKDLNSLSYPTFEEFDLKKYKVPESLPMEFSRGCVCNCPFCDFKSISPRFKSKSASYVFNQIKFYKEKYDINHITLVDPAVNGDIKTLEQISELLIKDNLSINISALAIPRKEMTPELLRKMKKAGFYRLEYGLESGSNKILKAMRKMFTAATAERVIQDTYRARN